MTGGTFSSAVFWLCLLGVSCGPEPFTTPFDLSFPDDFDGGVDLDGNGAEDLLVSGYRTFCVIDGATGRVLASRELGPGLIDVRFLEGSTPAVAALLADQLRVFTGEGLTSEQRVPLETTQARAFLPLGGLDEELSFLVAGFVPASSHSQPPGEAGRSRLQIVSWPSGRSLGHPVPHTLKATRWPRLFAVGGGGLEGGESILARRDSGELLRLAKRERGSSWTWSEEHCRFAGGLSDVDGDGVEDFFVGSNSKLWVFSGASGECTGTTRVLAQTGGKLGSVVSLVQDGAPRFVAVLDGPGGKYLGLVDGDRAWAVERLQPHLFSELIPCADYDGDGQLEAAILSWRMGRTGRVEIFDIEALLAAPAVAIEPEQSDAAD